MQCKQALGVQCRWNSWIFENCVHWKLYIRVLCLLIKIYLQSSMCRAPLICMGFGLSFCGPYNKSDVLRQIFAWNLTGILHSWHTRLHCSWSPYEERIWHGVWLVSHSTFVLHFVYTGVSGHSFQSRESDWEPPYSRAMVCGLCVD